MTVEASLRLEGHPQRKDAEHQCNEAGTSTADERLVALTLNGDDKAFGELVGRYKRRVLRMSSRFANDELETEEIAQDVFVKVHGSLKNYRGDAPLEHWIMRIAANTCRDVLRKRKSAPMRVPLEKVEHRLQGADDGDDGVCLAALNGAMEQLHPDDRVLLTLFELEGKKVREVAEILGIKEGNVKVRAFRARKALKGLFEKELGHE